MRIPTWAREYVSLDITTDADPTSDTIDLQIDDTWHTMTWTGAATDNGDGTWTRSAKLLVAGPDAADNPAGTVVLTAGPHTTAWRLTDDPELIGEVADAIIVG